jgi:hypothetical protein
VFAQYIIWKGRFLIYRKAIYCIIEVLSQDRDFINDKLPLA